VIKVCYYNDCKTEESSSLGSAGGDCYLNALSEQLEFCNLAELFYQEIHQMIATLWLTSKTFGCPKGLVSSFILIIICMYTHGGQFTGGMMRCGKCLKLILMKPHSEQ
jgi:hypothetical protein